MINHYSILFLYYTPQQFTQCLFLVRTLTHRSRINMAKSSVSKHFQYKSITFVLQFVSLTSQEQYQRFTERLVHSIFIVFIYVDTLLHGQVSYISYGLQVRVDRSSCDDHNSESESDSLNTMLLLVKLFMIEE